MNSDFSKIEKSLEESINYNFGNNLNVDGNSKSVSRQKSKATKLNGQVIILHTNWSKFTELYPWLYVENNNPNCRFCEQAIKDNDDMIETPWTKMGDSLTVKDSLLDEAKILKSHSKSENHEIAYQFMLDSGLIERKDNLEKENKTVKAISDLPGFMPITEWEELIKNFSWLYFKQNSFRCSICEEGFEKQRKAMFPTQWTCPDRMNQLGNPAQKSLRSFARFEKHQLTINHIKAIEIIKENCEHNLPIETEEKPVQNVIPTKLKDESKLIASTKKPMIFSAPNVMTRTAIRKSLSDRNSMPDFLDEKTWLSYKQEFPWLYCSKNQFRCSYCEDSYKTNSTTLVPTIWTCPDESENRNIVGIRRNQSKVRLNQHDQSKNHVSAAQLLLTPVKPNRRTKTRKSEPLKSEDQIEAVEKSLEQEPTPLIVVPDSNSADEILSKSVPPVVPRPSRKSAPMKLVGLSYDEKPETPTSDHEESRKILTQPKRASPTIAETGKGTIVQSPLTSELSPEEIASIPAFLTHKQYTTLRTRYPWFFCRVGLTGYGCQTCESAIRLQPESMHKSRLIMNGGLEIVDPGISYFMFRKRVYRHSESRNHYSALGIMSCESHKPVAGALDSARFTRLKTGSKSKIDYKRMSEGLLPCNEDSDEPHEMDDSTTSLPKNSVSNTTVVIGSLPRKRRQSACPATSSWLCPQCRSQFSNIDDLIRHIGLCDYQPPCESSRALACPCNPVVFRFNTITKLDLHAAQEHGTLPLFHCYICSDRFKRISPLYHHMLYQHLINWDPFEAYYPVEPVSPACCVVCTAPHPTEVELCQHYLQPGWCRDQLQSVRVVLHDFLVVPNITDMMSTPSEEMSLLPMVPQPVVEEVTILDVEELSEEKEAVIYSPLKNSRNQHNRISRNHPLRRFGPPSITKIKRSKTVGEIDITDTSAELDQLIESNPTQILLVATNVVGVQSVDEIKITESKTEELNNNGNVKSEEDQLSSSKSKLLTETMKPTINENNQSVEHVIDKIDRPMKPIIDEIDQSEKPVIKDMNHSMEPITNEIDSKSINDQKVSNQPLDSMDQTNLSTRSSESEKVDHIGLSIKPITEETDQAIKLITKEIDQSMESIAEELDQSTKPITEELNQSTKHITEELDQSTKPISEEFDQSRKPNIEELDQSMKPNTEELNQLKKTMTEEIDQSIKSVTAKINSEPVIDHDTIVKSFNDVDQSNKSMGVLIKPVKEIESIRSVDESINIVVESIKFSKKSGKTPKDISQDQLIHKSRKSISVSPRKSDVQLKCKENNTHAPVATSNLPVSAKSMEPIPVATFAKNNQSQIELQIDEPVIKKRRRRRTKKMIQMDEERRLTEHLYNPVGSKSPVRRKSSSATRPKRARLEKLPRNAKPEVINILTQVVDLNEIMRETEIRKRHPVQIKTGICGIADQLQTGMVARPIKKQPITIQSQLSPCKKLKPVPVPVDEDIPDGLSFMERMRKIRQLKKNRTEQQREQMMAIDRKIAEINERSGSAGPHTAALFAKCDQIRKLLSSDQYSMADLKSMIESSSKKEPKRKPPVECVIPSVSPPKQQKQEQVPSVLIKTTVAPAPPLPQHPHLSPRQVLSAPQTPTSTMSGSIPKPNSTASLPMSTSSTTVAEFFSCEVCQVGFKSLRARDNHATTEHKGLRLFCCQICELSFTTHILLRKHAQKYHIDNVSLAVFGKERSSNDASFSFQCSQCPLVFTSRSGLNHHVTSGHRPDDDPVSVIDEFISKLAQADSTCSPQSCCICHEVMENQFELEIHLIEHQKESQALENVPTQFACPKCCRLFFGRDGKSYLKDHYNIVHLEKQPPSCEECDTKFTSTICYMLHQKSMKNCSKKSAEQLKIDDPYEKLNSPSKLAFVCSRCQTLVAGEAAEARFARHQVSCNSDSYVIDSAVSPGIVAATAVDSAVNSSMSDDLITTNVSPDSLAADQT